MRVRICAVGRLRSGPERALIDDYVQRFDRVGRGLSLGPIAETEIDGRKAVTSDAEGTMLLKSVADGATLCALDERGRQMSSPDLAAYLERIRDAGAQDLAFVLGGADGLSDEVRAAADRTMSLGHMVWPHALARVMLAEQLYRAASILAGSPYHRA